MKYVKLLILSEDGICNILSEYREIKKKKQ